MDGWITIAECPNCHGGKLAPHKTVYTTPFFNVEFCHGTLPMLAMTSYVLCLSCKLIIQSPRMTDERIAEYYSSGTYRDTLRMSRLAMDKDEMGRAVEVASFLAQHNIQPKRHLDIGSSRGYLLSEVFASVQHGFDSNPNWSSHALIFSDKSKLETYDLVTAIHVLEHTTDPCAEIAWYKSLTTDKLLIEVPGETCKGGPLRFAHLFYFPTDTLLTMLIMAGMEVLEVEREPNTRVLCRKI